MPSLKEQDFEIISNNLKFLNDAKSENNGIIIWKDSEEATNTPETFKYLDALYSYIVVYGQMIDYTNKLNKNDNIIFEKELFDIDNDLIRVFDLILKDGFFPVPYLWQWDRPFDLMDMASQCCELCVTLFENGYLNNRNNNDLTNKAKEVLHKSVKAIIDAVTIFNGEYVWKGWSRTVKDKKISKINASTYFTSLCCIALSRYVSGRDNCKGQINFDFKKDDLIKYIKSALSWVISRYNSQQKVLYKYDDNSEQSLYWPLFLLLAVCDAKNIIGDISSDTTLEIWKNLMGETSKRIKDNRELFDSITMQIATPALPLIYEDRCSLGALTYSLLKYAQMFESEHYDKDFVLNYLISKVTDEIKNQPTLIMNNTYNLRAYLLFIDYKQPIAVMVPFKAARKLINDIIDAKITEMKTQIYLKLKEYEQIVSNKEEEDKK
ncbi:hypothetical protein MCHI_000773 [Candidatus Magnetoovum chiemensis]|nr:hypothetical protein MCHI_000773 [Candidatus Magnetoovum chiemensis]